MRSTPKACALVAAALAAWPGELPAASELVSQNDWEVANKSADAAEQYCKNVDAVIDEAEAEAGRQNLLNALGGRNIVLEELRAASSPSDFSSRLAGVLTVDWVVSMAAPIILAFATFACWLCYCWTACCRICHCFERKRPIPLAVKLGFLVGLLIGLGMIMSATVMTSQGYTRCFDGFEIISCSTAEMLTTTLSGSPEPFFIGMLPALTVFTSLTEDLRSDTSQMVRDLSGIMDSTVAIEQSSVLAEEVFNLMRDAMLDEQNLRPKDAADQDLLHDCLICEQLGPVLSEVAVEFSSSIATALRSARQEVAAQLSPERREVLAKQIDSAPAPLAEFKDSVISMLDPIISGGQYNILRSLIETHFYYMVATLCALAFLYFVLSMFSWGLWTFQEHSEVPIAEDCEDTMTKYNRCPHKISCIGWCCSVWCIFPALVIGGIFLAVSIPFAGFCLLLDELNGDLLDDVSLGTGLNISGDNGDIMKGMIDNCIAPVDRSSNANIMDLIFFNNGTHRVYLRDEFETNALKPINAAFEALDKSSGGLGGSKLSDSASVNKLMSLIANNPADAFVIPSPSRFDPADARWSALSGHPSTSDTSRDPPLTAASISTRCDNHTADGVEMPAPLSSNLDGIRQLVAHAEKTFTMAPVAGTPCLSTAVCAAVAPAVLVACNQFNDYMTNLKAPMFTSQVFKCPIFQHEDGTDCDPAGMTGNSTAGYTGDCLLYNVTSGKYYLKRKARTCTVTEFADYVSVFSSRLNMSFARVEDSADSTFESISTGLREAMDKHFISRLLAIMNGLTCGFMHRFFQGAGLDGFCFKGVVGMRDISSALVLLGVAVLWIAVVDYIMWRLQVDNVNREEEFVEGVVSVQTTVSASE